MKLLVESLFFLPLFVPGLVLFSWKIVPLFKVPAPLLEGLQFLLVDGVLSSGKGNLKSQVLITLGVVVDLALVVIKFEFFVFC